MTDHILVVDDSNEARFYLKTHLEDDGYSVSTTESGTECLQLLREKKVVPDLILLDFRMPELNGIETLKILKDDDTLAVIPVIMISASETNAAVIEAIDMGASDFVVKPIEFPVLASRIRSALRLRRSLEELESLNEKFKVLATTDSLTECYNRRHFFELSNKEVAKALRTKNRLSLIMLDIDSFKQVNDNFGHAVGDKAIAKLSLVCKEQCRESDIIGRIGGEEFAICCPNADLEGLYGLAERIREHFAAEKIYYGAKQSFSMTVSLGLAEFVEEDHSISETLKRADTHLYHAKKLGKNRVVSTMRG